MEQVFSKEREQGAECFGRIGIPLWDRDKFSINLFQFLDFCKESKELKLQPKNLIHRISLTI